jgi:hypothetical protein
VTVYEPRIEIGIPFAAWMEPGAQEPALAVVGSGAWPAEEDSEQGLGSFEAAVASWRRKSGIPRPSYAARAAVAAATVCRPVAQAGGWRPVRLGVVTASTSAAAWTAVQFEMRGLTEGWTAVDPLLLPSTLQSAMATQVAMAAGARAFALACTTGLLGVFLALEAAVLGLERGDADAVLVVVADERTEIQEDSHRTLGWLPVPGEFAGVLALERGAARGARLGFLGYGDGGAVPPGWEAAPRFETEAPFRGGSMQSGRAFRAIRRALAANEPRVVAAVAAPGEGCASAGFASAA